MNLKPNLNIYKTSKKIKKNIEDLEEYGATPSSKYGTADKFVEGVEMQELERPDKWGYVPNTMRNIETDRGIVSGQSQTPGQPEKSNKKHVDIDDLYDGDIAGNKDGTKKKKTGKKPRKKKQNK